MAVSLTIQIDFEDTPLSEVMEWLPELRDKAIEMGSVKQAELTGLAETMPLGW
jgi:type II secretory pathway component PulM